MKKNLLLRIVTVVCSATLSFGSAYAAMPGDLDTTFNGGLVPINVNSQATQVFVQPDGKILTVGAYPYGDWGFISRTLPNGLSDPTFGLGGVVRVNLEENYDLYDSVQILPDGKYLIVGKHDQTLALFRLNANGTPDLQYGAAGIRTLPLPGSVSSAGFDSIVQPDGKLIISGESDESGILLRLNQDGTFDSTFGNGGIAATNTNKIKKIVLQSNGSILANPKWGPIIRYNQAGTQDPTFGVSGVLYPIGSHVLDFELARDGIVVASGDGSFHYIQKYTPDGIIDTGFNLVMIPRSNSPHSFGPATQIAIQQNGKIVAAGDREDYFSVSRFLPNGAVDTGFGDNGIANTPQCGYCRIWGMALQSDGKIVAAGDWSTAQGVIPLIARYHGDEPVTTPNRTVFDFDGDGRADQTVFRASDSHWHFNRSKSGYAATRFGLASDELAPADFDDDGRTDIAVFRAGTWYWLASSDGSFNARSFGVAGDVPMPADFNGDGRAELAIYRNGVWWTLDLVNSQARAIQFGISTDIPVTGDFDGDGRSDPAVYRNGEWHVLGSENGYSVAFFGLVSDRPVSADYDGDGRTDYAVFRPAEGRWYVRSSATDSTSSLKWGIYGDLPVPADYDGDAKTDIAVFRNGVWYINNSGGGTNQIVFGVEGDRPVNFKLQGANQ